MTAGSVTKAAEMLFTSQPTVSRELARMEFIIGFALFERVHGRLRPTLSHPEHRPSHPLAGAFVEAL
jgi:DNA-binding transcriptional LysR family regulator